MSDTEETVKPKYIVRYARADQFPVDTDLRQAARDSVCRYALHFGLKFEWLWEQTGELWRRDAFGMAPTGVDMWFAQARVITDGAAE